MSKEGYPASDFPYTFYFNGVAITRWAQCWYASNLLELAAPAIKKWDSEVSCEDAEKIITRLDHIGVESYDPLRFRVIALQFLLTLLANQASVVASLESFAAQYKASALEIKLGIQQGLWEMIALVSRDQLAFWTVGYEADRLRLLDGMRRHQLPPDNPGHLIAPHISRERREVVRRWNLLRKQAITWMTENDLNKDDRCRFYELEKMSLGPHRPRQSTQPEPPSPR